MAEGLGVAALLAALVFLGSWLPLLELSRKVGAGLHGERHEAHCSLDYVVSYVVSSAIPAAIFAGVSSGGGDGGGGEGGGAGAMAALVTFACLGGVCVMLGNITLSRAAAMRDGIQLSTGMPLQASMTVSLGTSLNYFLQPDRSRPLPLALGVLAFLVAIASSAVASQRMASPRTITVSEEPSDPAPAREVDGLIAGEPGEKGGAASPSGGPGRYALESDLPANFLSPPSRRWSARAVSLLIVVIGGFALGGFTPCFNISVNDQFGFNKSRGGLSVWIAKCVRPPASRRLPTPNAHGLLD